MTCPSSIALSEMPAPSGYGSVKKTGREAPAGGWNKTPTRCQRDSFEGSKKLTATRADAPFPGATALKRHRATASTALSSRPRPLRLDSCASNRCLVVLPNSFLCWSNRVEEETQLGIPMSLSGQELAPQDPQSKVRQLELLLELTGAISRAQGPSEIYRAAAQGLVSALIADRAAVLIFDQDDVMRFKEWVGLSDKHRAAVEGHITWQRGARDALPITVSDSMQDFLLSAFWEVFAQEGIRALAFIPLIGNGGLIGKLMLYYNSPHEFQPDELQVAQAIASQVALAAERQVAEAALREKQQRLISIYNTVEDAIFHLAVEPNGQFRFVSVNAAFLRVTGLSQGKVVGKTVNEVIPEPSLMMVLGKYRQAIEEKTVVHWEEASDYPTGQLTGEVSVAPVFDDEGTCTELVGSVHDITQRKRDEAALRDREERLRASEIQLKDAQRLAKVGSWERRIDIAISQWSDENRRILGVSNDAPANFSTFISCVHPKDREEGLGSRSRSPYDWWTPRSAVPHHPTRWRSSVCSLRSRSAKK